MQSAVRPSFVHGVSPSLAIPFLRAPSLAPVNAAAPESTLEVPGSRSLAKIHLVTRVARKPRAIPRHVVTGLPRRANVEMSPVMLSRQAAVNVLRSVRHSGEALVASGKGQIVRRAAAVPALGAHRRTDLIIVAARTAAQMVPQPFAETAAPSAAASVRVRGRRVTFTARLISGRRK